MGSATSLGAFLTAAAAAASAAIALAASETPPAGPPWTQDFAAAQTKAVKDGMPLFVYMTKTY